MNRNSFRSFQHRNKQQESVRRALMTQQQRQRDHDKKQIDLAGIVNDQQSSRVTRVNLNNAYKSYPRPRFQQRASKKHKHTMRQQSRNDEEQQSHPQTSPIARWSRRTSVFSEQESFISSYQNNNVVGGLLYLLFIVFISAQILTVTFVVPKRYEGNQFALQKSLCILMIADTIYYLVVRYYNSVSIKKFIKYSSITKSFKKIVSSGNNYNSLDNQNQPKRTYMIVLALVVLIMLVQIVYCSMVISSDWFFVKQENNCMVSTIFWASAALPFLVQNFYINQIKLNKAPNLKLKLFPYLIFGFICVSIIESVWLFLFMCLKMIVLYLYTKQGYDMFHLRQLIKMFLLCLVLFAIIIKLFVMPTEGYFSWSVIAKTIGEALIITVAMLATRLIALIYLKQQLYQYFYNQMHIQLGFIFAAIIMYLCYAVFSIHGYESRIYSFIAMIFLFIIGVLVWLEGKERMQLCMDDIENEQHL